MADLATTQARLDLYLQAEQAILLGGQEGQIAGRKWKKADLPALQTLIARLQAEVDDLKAQAAGGSRLSTGVPR